MLIYGKQLFLYLLTRAPKRIRGVLLAKECDKKLFSKIAGLGVPITKLDEKRAQALAKGGNHQGFFAEIDEVPTVALGSLKDEEFIVMLCGLTDMGNIGAIVRSAYAFGCGGLIVAGVRDIKMENILRASSGAALALPIVHAPNAADALNELRLAGFRSYAADMHGADASKVDWGAKRVLILGNEGEGIPDRILKRCDERVSIRMAREFDSLNVSAAAAVLFDRICNG
jgi:23S rRNA (guanosine2251-2'-O)-methyltransferase